MTVRTVELSLYKRDYIRKPILNLIKYNKPIIVLGKYQCPKDIEGRYETFINIRPWMWMAKPKLLTQHITFMLEEFEPLNYSFDLTNEGQEYILVCRPYEYESDGIKRGGLKLDWDFPILPIFPANQWREILFVSQDNYIDMRKVFNGEYVEEYIEKSDYIVLDRATEQKKIHDKLMEKKKEKEKEAQRRLKAKKKLNKKKQETPMEIIKRKQEEALARWNKNQLQKQGLLPLIK